MWIEASVDSLALLADGARLLGGGYQGGYVWSIETGEQIARLWDYGTFLLPPGEQVVAHGTGFGVDLHRLDGSLRAQLVGKHYIGFSRDGAELYLETWVENPSSPDKDVHVSVVDLDGNAIGRLDTEWAPFGVIDLYDRWYALWNATQVQLRPLDGREVLTLPDARLACATVDGRFFVACDPQGVTIVETGTRRTQRIDAITKEDFVRVDGAGRLLCAYHDGSLQLLVVDLATGARKRDIAVGNWQIVELIAGNGVIAIVRGPRNLAFLDLEGGRVVESVELDEKSLVAIDREQATIAIVSPEGRFEVWSLEPPALLERDQLPAGPRVVTIGPRHIAIAYDRLVLVRPRP